MGKQEPMGMHVTALDIVGGRTVLGAGIDARIDLVGLIRRGLPIATAEFVLDSGRLTLSEVDRIVMPRKTLANRRRLGTLTAEQSDRLMRVAHVLAMAEETFGSREKAGIWMRRQTAPLDGEAPLNLLDTDVGARAVEALLGRVAYGIAA